MATFLDRALEDGSYREIDAALAAQLFTTIRNSSSALSGRCRVQIPSTTAVTFASFDLSLAFIEWCAR